jgi:hypothetical protein
MELEEETSYPTHQYLVPFFTDSVNVICSATNFEKTTLLINILKHQNFCFVRPINKAIIVLCNLQVNCEPYLQLADETLEIEVTVKLGYNELLGTGQMCLL